MKNCPNSRTINDIDMKIGPITKIDKRNTATSKNITMTSSRQILTSLSFFQFMANLEQSGSQIPDAWSVKLTFSLTVAFYLLKNESRTKKFLTQLLIWAKVLFLTKRADFLHKNADISKIKEVFRLKGIFSKTTFVCIYIPISIF